LHHPGTRSWSSGDPGKAHWKRYYEHTGYFQEQLYRVISDIVENTDLETEKITDETYEGVEYPRLQIYDWQPRYYLLIEWSATYLNYIDVEEVEFMAELHDILNTVLSEQGLIRVDEHSDARMEYVLHWLDNGPGRYNFRAFVEIVWEEEVN
jgi:hypothetical protein